MFKRVIFIASLLFCISYSVQAATLKAYIKYFSSANACTYTIYNFQDSSNYTGTNKGTLRYKWYYSDGTTDTGKSVTKFFTTTGNFTISLVVTNATDGLKDSTTKSLTISGTGILPSYSMTGPLCERSEPLFTLTSSKAASYFTSFGDGGTVSGTTLGNHTYATRGTYKFVIKDSTASGCKSSITNFLVIAARPFARAPSTPKNLTHCQDSSITFNVTQQAASDTQGMRVTYVWKFPDKSIYNGKTVTKFFADSGNITGELYAINHVGSCSDSLPFTFEVYSNPIVNFHLVPVCQDSIATIYDSSKTVFSGGGLYSWHWRICDSNHTNCDTTGGYVGFYAPIGITYGFPHGGSFYVTEYVKSYEGCADSATKLVYINPTPTPNFGFHNTCVDSSVQFFDSSTVPKGNSIKGWKWNFGDTTYLYTQNPAHQYKHPGYKYQVKLISKTQAGCIDSITKNVVVYPLPATNYGFLSECVGVKVPFASSSSMPSYAKNDNIAHYLWIYGDGGTDTGSTALHAFKTPGNHYVKLVAYSEYGCTDTATQAVFVYPLPRPNFKLVGDCERDSVIFENTSKASFGALKDTSYTWNFGDSLVANFVTNPKHLYQYSGTFPVTLKVTDSLQCSADTVINVSIIPGPHSSFTVGPKCTGEPINFTNTTFTKSAGTIKFFWNFGDGTPTDTNKNPVHTYSLSKNYRVRLTSFMPGTGCTDSTPLTLVPVTPTPIAKFLTSNNCVDSTIIFEDSSYVPGFPGSLSSEVFDFGDGHTGSGPVAKHSYAAPGNYKIREYVTSTSNCEDSFIRMVTVYPVPTAKFSYTISCAGTPTPFMDQTALTDSAVAWTWVFSNIDTARVHDTSHVFSDFDLLNASLTVYSNHGCPNTKYSSIIIEQSPVPTFNSTVSCNNRPYNFYGFNQNSNVFNPTFQWNFGDPADPTTDTSYGENAVHTFANAGNYWVKLKETSSQGCTNTDSTYINVVQLPHPGFTFFGNCVMQQYIFADTSTFTQNATFPNWRFGDGGTAAGKNGITYQYTVPGTYLVKMFEGNTAGCVPDTAEAYVVVNPLPSPNFVWDTTCFGQPFLLVDSTHSNGGSIASYAWDFGDGTTDSVFTHPNYYHTYADSFKGADTVYRLILKVSTNLGCSNSDTQHVVIRQIPYASFIANPDPADIQQPQVTFTNTTVHADPNNYYWTFGDGTDSHDMSPTHTYTDTGTYLVTLCTTNGHCVDTFRYIVYVTPGYTIYAPNCITVNGDGKNDSWLAKGVGVIDFDVVIVDRWGQQVFHSEDLYEPWNADYNKNGVKVPEGVYVYYIKAGDFSNTNFTTLKGTITVVR